jgi:hypothetical protein
MFRQLTLCTLLVTTLILCGCGKDGSAGGAYLSMDWDSYVDGYNDNNPDMPNAVSRNFNYSTVPGTYQCEYACSDASGDVWYWEQEYTISINQGEKGKIFRSGDNGKDRYHEMFLHGLSKLSFSVNEKSISKQKKNELKPYTLNTDDFKKVYHGDPIFEEYSANGYTTIVKRRMFTLE